MQYCIAFEPFGCSVGGNRTCIWSFGGSYTIHCTTTPDSCADSIIENLIMKKIFSNTHRYQIGTESNYLISPWAFVAKIFTAMASKTTPKNFRTAIKPAGPKIRSINRSDFNTTNTKTRLMMMASSTTV
jgi:hypothetical protein